SLHVSSVAFIILKLSPLKHDTLDVNPHFFGMVFRPSSAKNHREVVGVTLQSDWNDDSLSLLRRSLPIDSPATSILCAILNEMLRPSDGQFGKPFSGPV